MIEFLLDVAAGILILVGAAFSLTAAIGLVRLPEIYTRMHAASKAGTLGSCVMLLALAVHSDDWAASTRALAGIMFFLLTVPISSHLLARAAYSAGHKLWEGSVHDELARDLAANPALTGTREATSEIPSGQTDKNPRRLY